MNENTSFFWLLAGLALAISAVVLYHHNSTEEVTLICEKINQLPDSKDKRALQEWCYQALNHHAI